MKKPYLFDFMVCPGFKNGTDEEVQEAVGTALRAYQKFVEHISAKLVGKPHAMVQPRLDDPTKIDVIVRALVKKVPANPPDKKRKSNKKDQLTLELPKGVNQ
jgi:hypothetical protein